MLVKLQDCHRQIELSLSALADLLSLEPADMSAVASARVKLSRASTIRAKLIAEQIYPFLIDRADAVLQGELKSLSDDFMVKRAVSSEHVTRWSSATISADWQGYRNASSDIRRMMTIRIEKERAILYPALLRHSE